MQHVARVLSIAPSLELKLYFTNIQARLLVDYQSHHLWNWNVARFAIALTTEYTINRTISGIETINGIHKFRLSEPLSIAPSLELKPVCNVNEATPSVLSIAPSLELKLGSAPVRVDVPVIYQSHHLWNWNIMSKNRLSVRVWTINRTISGIETMSTPKL